MLCEKKIIGWCSCLLTILTLSCTYEPVDIYFKDISQKAPNTYINLKEYENIDTIRLFKSTTFEFSVGTDRTFVDWIQITIDDKLIEEGSNPNGSFSITTLNTTTGPHKLRIKFSSQSGTGSLADKVGAENFQVWKEWIILTDFLAPENPELNIIEDNGQLTLSWNKYVKPNFKKYTISVIQNNYIKKNIEIFDPSVNSWTDSCYLGGNIQYRLETTALGSTFDTKNYNTSLALNVSYNKIDSVAIFSWDRSQFSNFSKYVLLNNKNSTVLFSSDHVNDTSFVCKINPTFLPESPLSSYKLQIKSKTSCNYSLPETISSINVNSAQAFPHLPRNLFIKENAVMARSYNTGHQLFEYDLSLNLKKIHNTQLNTMAVAFNDPCYYSSKDAKIYQNNLLTGAQKVLDITTLGIPISVLFVQKLAVANNDIIGFTCDTYTAADQFGGGYLKNFRVLYNMKTNSVIDFYEFQTYRANLSISVSSDGDLVSLYNSKISPVVGVYTNDGASLQLIQTSEQVFAFREDKNNEMYATVNGILKVIDAQTQTTLRSILIPSGYILNNYDPISKYVLFTKAGESTQYVVNLDTITIRPINVYKSSYSEMKLLGGYLFCEENVYIKIIE